MRILVLSHYWFPESGVPQRRWQWLTSTLTADGHEVFVVAPPAHYRTSTPWTVKQLNLLGHSTFEEGPSGEKIIRSGYVPGGSSLVGRFASQLYVALSSVRQVRRARRELEIDLVVGTVPALPTAFSTRFIARSLGIPYVIDLRDAWPDLLGNYHSWNSALGGNGRRKPTFPKMTALFLGLLETVLERVLVGANALVSTSDDLATKLRHAIRTKEPGNNANVWVIRNVYPTALSAEESKPAVGGAGALKVLYAGTVGRAQNLKNAIKAAGIATARGVLIDFRIVGTGVADGPLQAFAAQRGVNVSFEPTRNLDQLKDLYDWADTALVHLTDWEPLERAVPSKTYEIMSAKVHISGVVRGETARLITSLCAGDVVPPEDPEALANLWTDLYLDRTRLEVGDDAAQWVRTEREQVAPSNLRALIGELEARNG